MLRPKKADNPVARRYKYLNYGLLGLASELFRAGYGAKVYHGEYQPPESFATMLVRQGLGLEAPLFLSLPSSFSIPWARAFTHYIRQMVPSMQIIVGGRWVVDNEGAWIRSKLGAIDLVVYGTAEGRVVDLLFPSRWSAIPGTDVSSALYVNRQSGIPRLLLELLDGAEEFHPSIEVSRGCGMGCSFCAEAKEPLTVMKDPHLVVDELAKASTFYSDMRVRCYLEASFFRPTTAWASRFRDSYRERGLQAQWRCESRVDALTDRMVGLLAESGLRVLDLGLESASPIQLLRMNKSQKPHAYLARASDLLKSCKSHGVEVKVNVLLFPGETRQTLDETEEWLWKHKPFFRGVSISPTVLYRYGRDTLHLAAEYAACGASLCRLEALEEDGFAELHLSPEISHEDAIDISAAMSRRFMTASDFFLLKAFTYFPRSYTEAAFRADITMSSLDALTFSVPRTYMDTESAFSCGLTAGTTSSEYRCQKKDPATAD
jgi:hypothetical protein